ncbi:ATP-dependent DNA helicase RecG [Fodinicurvata sp. EGI_FJ10296]|uniref:ATP-dependent DNA helicase RecG n=1 Tax=Fodinicurvata sp. EGI_FJ10296 TaxID=3231908 RepID=UPI00345739CE
MRPPILFPLFAETTALPGVGARVADLIEKVAGRRVVDLVFLPPSGLIDRRTIRRIADLADGETATVVVHIDEHLPPSSSRAPRRIKASDDSGTMIIGFFHARAETLQKKFPPGEKRVVSGRIDRYHGTPQMMHPDRDGPESSLDSIAIVEPVYPLTAGLLPRVLVKAAAAAVARVPDLPEWQDASWLKARGWPAFREATARLHSPATPADIEPPAPARARLAFDELLANQLALCLVRRSLRRLKGRPTRGDGRLAGPLEAALPFTLTGSQRQVLSEIAGDMAAEHRMLRLLQGDVGSGKTVVALMAMLAAVEAGGQAALLAPTEILARQHLQTVGPMAAKVGIDTVILTGREKGKARTRVLERLADGRAAIVVGTHALLEEDVAFRDLRLAVIDEQHRFGVHQRLQLTSKGQGVDVLVMTATPIPRTLQLTAYGDMEVSRIVGKPPGRQPVTTVALPTDRIDQVIEGLRRQISGGGQAYWVCPLVEDSEGVADLTPATTRYESLCKLLGEGVGLVHGRMKGAEKDAVMTDFAEGRLSVLVATTVIEVGVDVPNATVMVIEHAERFGLAQLHQLRGRVGRGSGRSSCVLVYAAPLGAVAKQRLNTLRETDDGFVIAEQDLKLRGAGELLGTRQSGLPAFRLADPDAHQDLMEAATDQARLILHRDPDLEGDIGKAARILLYLFERDAAIRYLRSG